MISSEGESSDTCNDSAEITRRFLNKNPPTYFTNASKYFTDITLPLYSFLVFKPVAEKFLEKPNYTWRIQEKRTRIQWYQNYTPGLPYKRIILTFHLSTKRNQDNSICKSVTPVLGKTPRFCSGDGRVVSIQTARPANVCHIRRSDAAHVPVSGRRLSFDYGVGWLSYCRPINGAIGEHTRASAARFRFMYHVCGSRYPWTSFLQMTLRIRFDLYT